VGVENLNDIACSPADSQVIRNVSKGNKKCRHGEPGGPEQIWKMQPYWFQPIA
jgi:hypothetical protein